MEYNNTEFEEKALLSVKKMCEYMDIGENTARNLLNTPHNPFTIRIGGRIYANKKALDKWIEQNTGII